MRTKEQIAVYQKQWVKDNPDKIALNRAIAKLKFYLKPIEEQREIYRARKARRGIDRIERDKKWFRQYQWKKRGIKNLTNELYEQKLKEQDNKCGICKEELKQGIRTIAADHDHKTGRFRGILCNSCNLAYGKFEKFKKEFNDYDSNI